MNDITVLGSSRQPLQRQAFVQLAIDRQFGLNDMQAASVHTWAALSKVDARFVAAIALVEHGAIVGRSRLFQLSNNPGLMKARDPVMPFVTWKGRDFIKFSEPYAGFLYLTWWLGEIYLRHFKLTTVRNINRVYAPQYDDNGDPDLRSHRMIIDMTAMLQRNERE